MGVIKTEAELLQQNTDTHRDEGTDAWKLKGPTRAAEARDLHGNIIASLFGAKADTSYKDFTTSGAVTVDYALSPNQKGPASSTTSVTVATKEDGTSSIPDGGDQRILLQGCAGQTIPLGGTGNVDLFTGEALPAITLPASGDCYVLVNNVAGVLRWSVTGTGGGGSLDTVNNVAPDAGTRNITLDSTHIENTVNDATWWGTAKLKIKGAFDYLANKVKLLEGRVSTLEQAATGGTVDLSGYHNKGIFEAFNATAAFDINRTMRLGGSGSAFSANHVLNNPASGNVADTFRTVIVVGNGANTVSVDSSWKNENGGGYDPGSGRLNVFRMHYLSASEKYFTLTQPAG